jgi:hypothetical protein
MTRYLPIALLVVVIAIAGTPLAANAATCINNRSIDEFGIDQGPCTGAETNQCTSVGGQQVCVNEPSASDVYAFKRQGVFGCSLQGSHSMSVGALSAVGGVYVPVNDAAVTLNTGYIVYKECVLRGVVNRQREAATAGAARQVIQNVASGRNGNPYFSQVLQTEARNRQLQSVIKSLENGSLDSLSPALKEQVKRAIAQGYRSTVLNPTRHLECPYQGNIQTAIQKGPFSWELLTSLVNPACNPYYAYTLAELHVMTVADADVEDMLERLRWGEGFYPVETCDEFGDCTTQTPGAIVRDNFGSALRTGFEQQARANDIDQMVGSLFSGIISQVIGDNRGIQGLLQQTGSQPSYLEQVVREANAGLRDAATNAALQILTAARRVELGYKQLAETIKSILEATVLDLRNKEAGCWEAIIQKVCAGPLASDKTCTEAVTCTGEGDNTNCPTAGKLKVATSTAFSTQAIRQSSLGAQATSTDAAVQRANQAIERIDRLIAGVTNTASLEAQRVALQQLDDLVARGLIRNNESQLQADQRLKDDVQASQETFRENTEKAWKEGNGWCNVNNQATLDTWKQQWRQ